MFCIGCIGVALVLHWFAFVFRGVHWLHWFAMVSITCIGYVGCICLHLFALVAVLLCINRVLCLYAVVRSCSRNCVGFEVNISV